MPRGVKRGIYGRDSGLQRAGLSASIAGMFKRLALGLLLSSLVATGEQQDDTVVETLPLPEAESTPQEPVPPAPAPVPEDTPPAPAEPAAAPQPEARPAPAPRPEEPAAPAPEDAHVVSQSRLFSVSGGDALRMGAIASRADDIYRHVCNLFGVDTAWKYAISIRLIGQTSDPPNPNPVRTRIAILGGEPNFQIRLYPGGGIDLDRLTNAIITMVLYERSLREMNPNALPETLRMPDWLVTGVQQAILWRRGRADRNLYRNLFNRAEMLSPEEVIATPEPGKLDAASRQMYDVSCGVLLMCLLNQPAGQASLRDLLADAAMAEGSPKEIIGRYFHELSMDDNLLNKWWALELASLSAHRATEALSPLETERQLTEALTAMVFEEENASPRPVDLEDTYALVQLPGWQNYVRTNMEQLVQLSYHCFPGYRLIITEYCRALAELLAGSSPDEVQNILGPLTELRRAYVRASIRGRDYLDWYEITHLGEGHGGSFDAYLDAMRLLRRRQQGRSTPISRYLDDIELLHTLEEGKPLPAHLRPTLPSRRHAETNEEEP